jgi:hypothetical protein
LIIGWLWFCTVIAQLFSVVRMLTAFGSDFPLFGSFSKSGIANPYRGNGPNQICKLM